MVGNSLTIKAGGGGWFVYQSGRLLAGFKKKDHAELFVGALKYHHQESLQAVR